MRNIYKMAAALLVCLSANSCDGILNKDALDTFTDNNFWISEDNVKGYANTFFNRFTGYGNGSGGGDFYFKTLSDDQAGSTFADWTYKQTMATSSDWQNGYISIRRANLMLERIPGMTSMDEATKNHWLGVGHLMRAWEYYHLVRMFGDVPWVDKAVDATDKAVLYGPRTDRDSVMDHVLDDINFACTNMKETSPIEFNQDLAYAMKAEICLYEATFRHYRSTEAYQKAPDLAGAKKFAAEAKSAAANLMGKKYSLNASYQGNYNSVDLSSNPEMIFYKAYKDLVFYHSTIDYTSSSTQMSGMTKDAFDAYLFTDGKPKALTAEDKSDLPELQINGTDTVYSLDKLLAVRDKRLSETIDNVVLTTNRPNKRVPGDMNMTSSTGYGVKKYDNIDLPILKRDQTGSNYTQCPLFWISVVYLEYAEASAELAELGGDPITQADLDNSINKLRARAGVAPLSVNVGFNDPANNMNVSSLLWEIRRERRCELMFDNWTRYWDLIRWHQLDKLDSSQHPDILLGANLKDDPDVYGSVSKKGDYMDASKGLTRTYDPKYYLYPIPSGQTDLNPQLTNNPGW